MPQNPIYNPFYGMDPVTLQNALAAAQTALIEMQLGKKAVQLSYTQGDGSRSATYQATSRLDLENLINQIKAALGQPVQRRGPLKAYF